MEWRDNDAEEGKYLGGVCLRCPRDPVEEQREVTEFAGLCLPGGDPDADAGPETAPEIMPEMTPRVGSFFSDAKC